MLKRNVTVTLEKAKEWYNNDNATLKEVALQAFSEKELNTFDFTQIKTFNDALNALGYCSFESRQSIKKTLENLKFYSEASAAMFKLNIIRRALNKGYDLHLTKNVNGQNHTWYPYFKFIAKSSIYHDDELKRSWLKKLGEITSEGVTYDVLGGGVCNSDVSFAFTVIGFLGCVTEEIAKHFGLHFDMLVMEAMYGDIVDFEKSK